jgi:microcompartment protein CcmK/EutM
VGAGIGEIVLVASGSSARLTEVTKEKPVDAVICGIVDTIEARGSVLYQKHTGAEVA